MRKLGKRGFVAEALVDFYAYFAYILIILVFVLLFALQSCEGKVEQKLEDKFIQNQAEINLINYLRTPVDDSGKTIADLILVAELDEKMEEQLIDTTKKMILASNQPAFSGIGIKYPSRDIYDPIIIPVGGITQLQSNASFPSMSGIIIVNIYGLETTAEAQKRRRAATGYRVS